MHTFFQKGEKNTCKKSKRAVYISVQGRFARFFEEGKDQMAKFVLIEDASKDGQMPHCWIFETVEDAKKFAFTRFAFNVQEDGFDPDDCEITWTEESSKLRSIRGEENYPGPCAVEIVWYVIQSEN